LYFISLIFSQDQHLLHIMCEHSKSDSELLPARSYASAGNSDRNVSVCLSRAGI